MFLRLSKPRIHSALEKKEQKQPTNDTGWQDGHHIVYILKTAKICYLGEFGEVTIESIRLDQLESTLTEIRAAICSGSEKKQKDAFTNIITVKICGISWQFFDGNKRVRAIKDAATLLVCAELPNLTQAIFTSGVSFPSNTEHASTHTNKHQYFGVSATQFIEHLVACNRAAPRELKHSSGVNKDNFKPLFTPAEEHWLFNA